MTHESTAAANASSLPWNCPVCRTSHVTTRTCLPPQPVDVGFTYTSRQAAQNATPGSIELVQCPATGMIRNLAFDSKLIAFQAGYSATLETSTIYREHALSVAQQLTHVLNQQKKVRPNVLEIGCGDGSFLRLLADAIGTELCRERLAAETLQSEVLGIEAMGIDPTLPEPVDEQRGNSRIRFAPVHFDQHLILDSQDLIVCRSVLEDIAEPIAFLAAMGRHLKCDHAALYLEVFNGEQLLTASGLWSFHYEQANYFTRSALRRLLSEAGLPDANIEACFANQYLQLITTDMLPPSLKQPHLELYDLPTFGRHVEHAIAAWNQQLARWRSTGETAVVWGTGGKGVCFLNYVDPACELIEAAVDINPLRAQRYVACSGHQIIAPADLKQLRPNHVLLSNGVYATEIQTELTALGLAPELHVI